MELEIQLSFVKNFRILGRGGGWVEPPISTPLHMAASLGRSLTFLILPLLVQINYHLKEGANY
jgi:hypothetical protein